MIPRIFLVCILQLHIYGIHTAWFKKGSQQQVRSSYNFVKWPIDRFSEFFYWLTRQCGNKDIITDPTAPQTLSYTTK